MKNPKIDTPPRSDKLKDGKPKILQFLKEK
jgi:hypothetical protein